MTLTYQPPADAGDQPLMVGPSTEPGWLDPAWRPLERSARWVMRGLALQAVLLVVVLVGELNGLAVLAAVDGGTTTLSRAEFSDRWDVAASLAWTATLLITGPVFIVWFRHAHRNLAALSAYGMHYSSGWAVGGWFVPFANLVIPKRMADELWRGSEPDTISRNVHRSSASSSSRLVPLWWALWIAAAIVGSVARQLLLAAEETDALMVATGVYVLDSVLLLAALVAVALMVTRITERQRVRTGLLGLDTTSPAPRRNLLMPLAVAGLVGLVAAGGLGAASLRAGAGEPTIGELVAEEQAAAAAEAEEQAAIDRDSDTLTDVDQACLNFGETRASMGEPQDLAGVAAFFEEVLQAATARDAVIASATFVSPEEQSAFDARFRQPIEADTAVMRAAVTPVVEAARTGDGARAQSLLASYPETQGIVEPAASYANERDMTACAAVFSPPPPDA